MIGFIEKDVWDMLEYYFIICLFNYLVDELIELIVFLFWNVGY